MEERKETVFDLPVFQIVENLIGGAVCAVFNRPKVFHIVDVEI